MTCLNHQWRISRSLDENREILTSLRTHLEACPSCRNFYEINRQLNRPHPVEETVSPLLHEKIMRGVEAAEPKPAAVPMRAWAGALASLAVLIAAATLHPASTPPAPEPVAVFTDVESITDVVAEPLGALADSPGAELERIKNDIRSVTAFFMAQL